MRSTCLVRDRHDRFAHILSYLRTHRNNILFTSIFIGIPIYNCNSNCSTGANALNLAKQLIETGNNDCILAVGFEKMEPGSLGAKVREPISVF